MTINLTNINANNQDEMIITLKKKMRQNLRMQTLTIVISKNKKFNHK